MTPLVVSWRHRSSAELGPAEGSLFRPHPGPDPVPPAWRGEPADCYRSAALWATHDGLAYVEGCWAAIGPLRFGTEHAWCAQPCHEYAPDPTWLVGEDGAPTSA